jgi:hypothetical protein
VGRQAAPPRPETVTGSRTGAGDSGYRPGHLDDRTRQRSSARRAERRSHRAATDPAATHQRTAPLLPRVSSRDSDRTPGLLRPLLYPFDPNLISQGVPPDDRANADAKIYGPVGGSPKPAETPASSPPNDTAAVAPSAYSGAGSGPSVAIVKYDPKTGRYVDPQGNASVQTNLAAPPTEWTDLLLPTG